MARGNTCFLFIILPLFLSSIYFFIKTTISELSPFLCRHLTDMIKFTFFFKFNLKNNFKIFLLIVHTFNI